MTDRVQVSCLKQGVVDGHNWSKRILTLDKRTGTLTISRRNHPNNAFYHSLKPKVVQCWPHFCMDAICNDCFSAEAKRTLCVTGTAVSVPDFTGADDIALVAVPVPSSSLVTPMQRDASSTAASFVNAREQRRDKTRSVRGSEFDAWMLRLTSEASYKVVVQLLSEMEGVKFAGKRHQQIQEAEDVVTTADTASTFS